MKYILLTTLLLLFLYSVFNFYLLSQQYAGSEVVTGEIINFNGCHPLVKYYPAHYTGGYVTFFDESCINRPDLIQNKEVQVIYQPSHEVAAKIYTTKKYWSDCAVVLFLNVLAIFIIIFYSATHKKPYIITLS